MRRFIALIVCLTIPYVAQSAVYKYNELMIKDYDEMQNMVQSFIRKARKAAEKEGDAADEQVIDHLTDALQLVFSRPDTDNMVAKLVPEVRRELLPYNAFESVISKLASDALIPLTDEKAAVSVQSTALVELENLLAEIRPEVMGGNAKLRDVVQRIADADIKISDDVKKDRRLRGMFKTKNPSEDAKNLLKALKDKKKK